MSAFQKSLERLRLAQELAPVIDAEFQNIESEVLAASDAQFGDTTAAVQEAAMIQSQQGLLAVEAAQEVGFLDRVQESMHWNTLTASLMRATQFDEDPNWQHTETMRAREREDGIWAVGRMQDYLANAKSQEDYDMRYSEALFHLEQQEKLSMNAGTQGVVGIAADLLGGIVDPLAMAASLGTGLAVSAGAKAVGVGGLSAWQSLGVQVVAGAAENAALEASVQEALYNNVDMGDVGQAALWGALFNSGFAALGSIRPLMREAGDWFGTFEGQVRAAEDAVRQTAKDQTAELAQEAIKRVQEGRAADADEAVKQIKAERAVKLDPDDPAQTVEFMPVDRAELAGYKPPREPEYQGLRVSEAEDAFLKYVDSFDETPPAELTAMQKALQTYYDLRERSGGDSALGWTDSVGLRLVNSPIKAVRVAAYHLVESASGKGIRKQTAALEFSMLKDEWTFKLLPTINQNLAKWMDSGARLRHISGGAFDKEIEFSRAVQIERLRKRAAHMQGKLDEFKPTENAPIRETAEALDKFFEEVQTKHKAAGTEAATVMGSSPAVGHIPYRLNGEYIIQTMREEGPAVRNAMVDMLTEEYHAQEVTPMIEKFLSQKDKLIADRQKVLEERIAGIQDKLADIEKQRRTVSDARNKVKDAEGRRRELKDMIQEVQDTIKQLEGQDGAAKQIEQLREQLKELRSNRRTFIEQREAAKGEVRKIAEDTREAVDVLDRQLGAAKKAYDEFLMNPDAYVAEQARQLRVELEKRAHSMVSAYFDRALESGRERIANSELRTIDLVEELIKENFAGTVVNDDVAKAVRDLLADRALDRTRREMNLLRSRKVNGKEVLLMDLFRTDITQMVSREAHVNAGEIALARKGWNSIEKIEATISAARKSGASEEEIQNLRYMFESLRGQVFTPEHNQVLEGMLKLTYASRMGMQGINMLGDLANAAGVMQMHQFVGVLGRMAGQLLNGDAFRTADGKPTPLMKELQAILPGALGNDYLLMNARTFDPVSGAEMRHSTRVWSRSTARAAQFISSVSGANLASRMTHRAVLPVLAENLYRSIMGKSSVLSPARLADMGLSGKSLERVRAQLEKYAPNRKRGDALNLEQWDDPEAVELFRGTAYRAVTQVFNKRLPGEETPWANTVLGRLFGQLRTFGITAAEKAAARQFSIADGGTAQVAVLAPIWGMLLYLAKVHSQTFGMDERERKEFVQRRTEPGVLAIGTMNMMAISGIASDLTSAAQLMMGNATATSGPAAVSYMNDVRKAVGLNLQDSVGQYLGAEDVDNSERVKATLRAIPGGLNTIPGATIRNIMTE